MVSVLALITGHWLALGLYVSAYFFHVDKNVDKSSVKVQ